jgi:CRISPR type III-B/RAMP module-associated protein Cmr5
MSRHTEQINLQRAKSALDCVRRIRDRNEKKLVDDYLNAVEQFPFAARRLGLGQALALLAAAGAKGDEDGRQHPGYQRLYEDLKAWLCADEELRPYRRTTDLLDALTAGGQQQYREALIETEAYFAWLKPFAQALLSQIARPDAED